MHAPPRTYLDVAIYPKPWNPKPWNLKPWNPKPNCSPSHPSPSPSLPKLLSSQALPRPSPHLIVAVHPERVRIDAPWAWEQTLKALTRPSRTWLSLYTPNVSA